MRKGFGSPASVLVLVCSIGLVLVILIAALAPHVDDDPEPTTANTGKAGANAALLLLGKLGVQASASEQPLVEALPAIPQGEIPATTLVLAEPALPTEARESDHVALNTFLSHGGSVLATGANGAALLGHSELQPSSRLGGGLCASTPEGRSELARAGTVSLAAPVVWAEPPSTAYVVAQRCGGEAVVVQWKVGAGTATWWSDAHPLSNLGLHDPASLRLLLASLGPAVAHRASTVLFDESLHGALAGAAPDPLKGLPLPLLLAQFGLVAALGVFSFSRRHGPIRAFAARRHTYPLEFAHAMGALYSRGGATDAPVEAAARRLGRVLQRAGGLSPATVSAGQVAVQTALEARFGASERWAALARALQPGDSPSSVRTKQEALARVRALDSFAHELPRWASEARGEQVTTE